ncbi:hypothetical protein, partial [Nostoc sp. JL34]|uniref:hypothetical protein n=2 Tax=unclassified Nostoc TaxID=2593658 RepID=UPI0025D6476F
MTCSNAQVSYILEVLEMTDVNFWRLADRGNRLKEVSCEIQQSVLKKVTNHENTAFETLGKVDYGNIINCLGEHVNFARTHELLNSGR